MWNVVMYKSHLGFTGVKNAFCLHVSLEVDCCVRLAFTLFADFFRGWFLSCASELHFACTFHQGTILVCALELHLVCGLLHALGFGTTLGFGMSSKVDLGLHVYVVRGSICTCIYVRLCVDSHICMNAQLYI